MRTFANCKYFRRKLTAKVYYYLLKTLRAVRKGRPETCFVQNTNAWTGEVEFWVS